MYIHMAKKNTPTCRLSKAGVQMTTVESCVMELMQTSKHPEFKSVAGMLKAFNSGSPQEFKNYSKF